MAKTTKKNLKLRKRVRRTMGTICLITALIVAAIPVPETAAADANGEGKKYIWDEQVWKGGGTANTSDIPVVDKDEDEIYTTGDGTYQFAYVNESESSSNKIAVILGYNARNLTNNYLEIPDEVDAYTKYNNNQGSFEGYVAVSRNKKPLFYGVYGDVPKLDADGNPVTDPNTGEVVTENVIVEYRPCYYGERNNWESIDLAKFYYYDDASDEYVLTTFENDQWIKNIKVFYIGNQTLTAVEGTTVGAVQGWKIAEDDGKINTEPLKGVFANNTNIRTLVIGENLKGIGNWAFYGCGGLNSVTLGNGLEEIGKYAFADCINITTVDIPFLSNITYIADYAFQNCRALTSFVLPASVQYIYDHAFDGCVALSSVDISGNAFGENVNLKDLGYYVFKGCTSLTDVRIPYSFVGDTTKPNVMVLNNFKDCSNLRRIEVQTAPSALTSMIELQPTTGYDGDAFTVDMFKAGVHETFYFECVDVSKTHEFTKANAIAFKYANEDKYEIIIQQEGEEILYQVNSLNELLYFEMSGPVSEVTIPSTIGPYGISAINQGSFSGNCHLKKIVIPSTVVRINQDAFKGCHNLEHVVFENAANIVEIEQGAFATQVIDASHKIDAKSCKDESFLEAVNGVVATPKLTFTGTVGSHIVPFNYAMNPTSNINAGAQPITYITYYSGWPTNLEVSYNRDKDTAELVDYPTFSELKTNKYTPSSYPYMKAEYQDAAQQAFNKYSEFLANPNTQITADQWDIINAALNVVIPEGVTGIKTGLFSGVTADENGAVKAVSGLAPDTSIQSITFNTVKQFEPYTISGCKNLTSLFIKGGAKQIDDYAFAYAYTTSNPEAGSDSALEMLSFTSGGDTIGNYVFQNHPNLTDVTVSPEVTTMGLRPFKDCTALETVSFGGGPYFTCDGYIIFQLSDGAKKSIVQCLPNRSKTVAPSELSGVSEMYDEAFMDCDKLGSIDFSESLLSRVPKSAFQDTDTLFSVVLPNSCKSISTNAFHDSSVQFVEIPGSVTFIDPYAFNTNTNLDSEGKCKEIEFLCEAGSAAETYANEYENIVVTDRVVDRTFSVRFYDYPEGTGEQDVAMVLVEEQLVKAGEDAVPPTPVGRAGYVFKNWSMDYTNVSRDMDIAAVYEKEAEVKYTVTFYDWNDTVLYTQSVAPGGNAITPQDPVRTGYKFTGWRPSLTNITKDTDVYAMYEPVTSTDGTGGTGGNGGSGTGGNGTTGDGTLYTLTVKNGSGSGSYVAGAQIPIIANEAAKGQRFDEWKVESGSPTLVSSTMGATFLTMPAGNVIVSATFEKDPNYSGSSGSNSGSNSGNNSNNSSTTKPGTVIVIDKNGLSNTGVVSATVNGSSDNFVIKVTENREATEAILRALKAEYGNIDDLKYFPMDISLYDSTGKTKITDTIGLSITITLPLPDSLIKYAGNNKVASVQNSKLDKLGAKFATIDGVACVTFTAEHFSPYVIYVDTGNLISAGTTDESPKTGDLHPKWFLVFGLTCLAAFLFLKKDKQAKKVLA